MLRVDKKDCVSSRQGLTSNELYINLFCATVNCPQNAIFIDAATRLSIGRVVVGNQNYNVSNLWMRVILHG